MTTTSEYENLQASIMSDEIPLAEVTKKLLSPTDYSEWRNVKIVVIKYHEEDEDIVNQLAGEFKDVGIKTILMPLDSHKLLDNPEIISI